MKEHNALRLQRIAARYDAHARGADAGADLAATRRAAFLHAFEGARDEVLRPVMNEVGAELARAGHSHEIVVTTTAKDLPRVELHVRVRGGKPKFKNVIVFFVAPARTGDLEIVAELELGNAIELGRFEGPAALARDVVEQMVVDAVEHMFACNEG